MPLFDPNSLDDVFVDPEASLSQVEGEVIEEPFIGDSAEIGGEFAMEETKEGFLDASEVDVIPTPPPIANVNTQTSNNNAAKHEGLAVGSFFAIIIFVSLLIYIFRKCRILMQPGLYQPVYKNSGDHLSSLL